MNKWASISIASATILGLLALAFFGASPANGSLAGPTVKILVGQGNGSGVHIGNGHILTAAHVTKLAENNKVKVKTDNGQEVEAEVLWQSTVYDVALLHTQAGDKLSVSNLACRAPDQGEGVSARGNPLGQEFIVTWGRVAAPVRTLGPWKDGVLVDISIGPGSSGGPLFDRAQRVVGLVVGMFTAQPGFAVVVPASTICALLAR